MGSDDHRKPADGCDDLLATQLSTRSVTDSAAPDSLSQDRVPVLMVLQGQEIGRRYLLNESSLVLGRHPARADMVIHGDSEISSGHFRIERGGGAYLVTDLGSLNGTWLNGGRLAAHDPQTLQEGDKIFLGRTAFKFSFQDALEEDFHIRVERIMTIDELTGLVVKRTFDQKLDWAVTQAREAGQPLFVLMMDMDGLKAINDANGHHVGAGTIAEVGHILGEIVNPRGCVTRWGGDEFTAYLAPCSLEDGLAVAEQIRLTIEEHTFCVAGVTVFPTISVGVSAMPRDGHQRTELVRAADAALYRAKAAGRNVVSE